MAFSPSSGHEPLLNLMGFEGPAVIVTPIDFSGSPLAGDYNSFFAMTIDNLLTPDECIKLQGAAGDDWQTLSKGNAFRECQNILVFSPEWASALYDRIVAHLPEEVKALRKGDRLAETIAGSSHLKASMGARKTVWRIKEINERLSFLRYQPGHHFRPHCDALYARPGKNERSFLTCQIYLNDAPGSADGESSGGETRFWTSQVGKRQNSPTSKDEAIKDAAPFLDIKPKMGRALVFQQRMLWHSGQEVKHGEKFTIRRYAGGGKGQTASMSPARRPLPPSSSLPPLRSLNDQPEPCILSSLGSLHTLYCPLPTSQAFQANSAPRDLLAAADSGYASDNDENVEKVEEGFELRDDPYERAFAERWLTGFLGRAEELTCFESEESRQRAIDKASCVLASFFSQDEEDIEDMEITRDYHFTLNLDSCEIEEHSAGTNSQTITVQLTDGLAGRDSTDHTDVGLQSWGAAFIFTELMCATPMRLNFTKNTLSSSPRIIELGAGTGLSEREPNVAIDPGCTS
ncbi:hypothetical protein O1611_g8538 [Lasiodiplodia mahajangana]|uniref:Uncharacterized protein n=1 Tax=Lasiodiplodia mahajangana TaxID=1108764 RepID=A0ACC2JCI5_9PEZI|nr:hypothetical protein O1611_g8538 [Lasiodiplodia mahajangana]